MSHPQIRLPMRVVAYILLYVLESPRLLALALSSVLYFLFIILLTIKRAIWRP